MTVRRALLAVLVWVLGPPWAASWAGPREAIADSTMSPELKLQAGRLAYGHADYKGAIAALRPLIYPSISLASEKDLIEAYKVLGLSYFFEQDLKAARREFENALELDPNFELDPVVEAVSGVAFFDSVKKDMATRIQAIKDREERERLAKLKRDKEKRERDERLRLALRERVIITRVEQHNVYARNFIPFGVPQFLNGDRGKGTFLLVTESVFGGISFGTFYYLLSHYGGKIPRKEVGLGNTLQAVEVTSGGVFYGLAVFGVIDAIRHYHAVEVEEHQTIVKPTLPAGAEPLPPASPKTHTWLNPFALPGGGGIGLGGTF